MYSVLRRYGFSKATQNEDRFCSSVSDFLHKTNVADLYPTTHLAEGWRICNPTAKTVFTIEDSNRCQFISARVVLALSAMMGYGRKSMTDSMGKKVYDELIKSSYAEEASVAYAESLAKNRAEEAKAKAGTEQAAGEKIPGARVDTNGNLIFSAEFFAAVIKSAVREAISEVKQTTS